MADNFEHVLAAAPFIGALLGACPRLTVLATSREPLALQAEERHPVPPLSLPELGTREDTKILAGEGAVTLFIERARAHDPGFVLGDGNAAAVAEICRRVDGLPLAIELAAARCGLLSPAEIAERLEVALGAPGAAARDAPARHHTLRATVDWSYQLLSDGEQVCFARFAVFGGGATIEAAEAVTGADLDTLDHFVAKSLLVRQQGRRTCPPGCRCSRRSAPTPPSAWRQPMTAMPSARATTTISSRSPSTTGPSGSCSGSKARSTTAVSIRSCTTSMRRFGGRSTGRTRTGAGDGRGAGLLLESARPLCGRG